MWNCLFRFLSWVGACCGLHVQCLQITGHFSPYRRNPLPWSDFTQQCLGSTSFPIFDLFLQLLYWIWRFSANSEGGVRLGMFFYVEWWWNHGENRSVGWFIVLGDLFQNFYLEQQGSMGIWVTTDLAASSGPYTWYDVTRRVLVSLGGALVSLVGAVVSQFWILFCNI